jgi:hypothetical protein
MGYTPRATHLTPSILAIRWELQFNPKSSLVDCHEVPAH